MKIFIHDEFNPQDIAMMQALYSRSPLSVEDHIEKVKKTGSGNFMERFYVGYGHASIADCGSTTIFIEDVSMLAAKAVQQWPLYSGQETSTRYIDMSSRHIVDPIGTKQSKKILDDWMKFITYNQLQVETFLSNKYPKQPSEDEKIYSKAIKARAFDMLRGFLPAGMTTQLSWHTNLRQAHDKLALLKHHPLKEVKEIANIIRTKLVEKYSQSFGHKEYEAQEDYRNFSESSYAYFTEKKYSGDFKATTNIKRSELDQYKKVISKRPIKTHLPLFLGELGNVTYEFLIDFGSFRDIQRHRNGVCRMPLLSTKFGFHNWYLSQLPEDLRKKAETLIKEQKKAISSLKAPKEIIQYYVAMGFMVPAKVTYALPASVYTMELRSGKLVHPTLRIVAHKMYKALKKMFPNLSLHADLNLDDWDVRRGAQDIQEKNQINAKK